jgi:hypothetical protein
MIKLTRYGSLPNIGTFGKLDIGVHTYYTVERPWANNEPFVSCIPAGEYVLVPHQSDKFGGTYALIGETVSQFPDPNHKRYACLIHAANWPEEVQGCIGVGRSLQYINGKLGVTDSRNTVAELKRYLSINTDYLMIEWSNPETHHAIPA